MRFVMLVGALLLGGLATALAYRLFDAREPGTCSVATVHGAFGFSSDTASSGPGGSIRTIGLMLFDGAGKWEATYTAGVSGAYVTEGLKGTYSVKDNCTGLIDARSDLGQSKFYMVVDRRGTEVRLLGGRANNPMLAVAAKQ